MSDITSQAKVNSVPGRGGRIENRGTCPDRTAASWGPTPQTVCRGSGTLGAGRGGQIERRGPD